VAGARRYLVRVPEPATERPSQTIRLTTRDRFLAWIVTGPVGRFVAFFWDFFDALGKGAAKRLGRG
jgi:hypothetical protein